jgi:acetyl-CoA acetyltransferase
VKLQLGDVDTALIYSYSKSSPGPVHEVLSRQLDPFFVAPLWPDAISLAALQARALIDSGKATEKELAEVVARSRTSALDNPHAQLKWNKPADEVLAEAMLVDPLRKDDCPPITDGVAAVVLAADDVARGHCDRPAWIRGIDHRIESAVLGLRDLTDSPSTRTAGVRAGVAEGPVDVAELHAPFSHQELILRDALGLGDGVEINPSGGALCANPIMAAGLIRFGEAAQRVIDRRANRAVAHATSGACLQQNIVCVLEGDA